MKVAKDIIRDAGGLDTFEMKEHGMGNFFWQTGSYKMVLASEFL
jgi:hypothetical protein